MKKLSHKILAGALAATSLACTVQQEAMNEPVRPAFQPPRTQVAANAPSDSGKTRGKPRAVSTPRAAPAAAAGVTVTTIGYSTGNAPLVMHAFNESGGGDTVLIFGGIHGNEPTSAGVCRELLGYLSEHPEAVRGVRLYLIPEANPDGLRRGLRTNGRLVDLNRNFPSLNWKKTRRTSYFGGDAAGTEPETQALVALVDRLRPVRIVSVHSMDDPCNNYDGPAEPLARLMARYNGYEVRSNIGYPTPGSFGSWAGIDRRIPVVTLELARRDKTPVSWGKNRDALLAFIRGR